jgi:hypothetical protein
MFNAFGDVRDLKALSKDLTEEDHMIIVGGPDSSLGKDLIYQIEKDLDNIVEKSSHENVEFVSLECHDRHYMSKWARSVNLRCERAAGPMTDPTLN